MTMLKQFFNASTTSKALLGVILLGLYGCGSGSDDDSDAVGYVKFYHVAQNAPKMYLTLDEDIDSDDDDDVEVTYLGIDYGSASSANQIETNNYTFELAWQENDSTTRDELSIIYQSDVTIEEDVIKMIVLSEDVTSPSVNVYHIPVIEDDDDTENDLFNIRVLNMFQSSEGVDVYISGSDETFNEAVLLSNVAYQELSENTKFAEDDYIFYITAPGSDDVLFQSEEVSFPYSTQYVMSVRANTGAGSSSYVIDRIAPSSIEELTDFESEAKISAYNAIQSTELLESYQEELSLTISGINDTLTIGPIGYGQLSAPYIISHGDYSLDLTNTADNSRLLSNHLLSLSENSDKTVFFYADEENVDEDGDGDVDENGDGIVDEIEINIHSMVLTNTTVSSIYQHNVTMINLVDSDDFQVVNVYFVRNDETIDTALNHRSITFANNDSITLNNNTYKVFVTAQENSSDIILNAFDLVLNEESTSKYLIMEIDENSPSGYKATLIDQLTQ
ncbi:hypothetical protein [Thalassotalea profundi]|uniref:DUF4397 domain-containing protein n=1 Tax=Thalassotalea profundi TaxID=2036687 RepID=A0ABQ3IN47_9GAMM|nr:hypothetical protein [Thalassotalea profundi]GHE89255.1 hypothetical protein GCM10011501_18450 [Thalassotalea profundi]